MDGEDKVIRGVQIETLCLLRRLAVHTDMEVLLKAKSDARNILRQMGMME